MMYRYREKTQEMMKCSGRPPGIIHRVNTNQPQSKLIIFCTYCTVVEYHYGQLSIALLALSVSGHDAAEVPYLTTS